MKEYLYKIHVMLCYFILLPFSLFSNVSRSFFCLFMVLKQNAVNPTGSGPCDVVFPVIKEYGFPGIELIHRAEFFINLSIRFCHFINIRKQCSVHVGQEFHLVAGQPDTYAPHSSTEYTDGIPVLSGFLPNLQRMASVPPRHQDYHIPSALLF